MRILVIYLALAVISFTSSTQDTAHSTEASPQNTLSEEPNNTSIKPTKTITNPTTPTATTTPTTPTTTTTPTTPTTTTTPTTPTTTTIPTTPTTTTIPTTPTTTTTPTTPTTTTIPTTPTTTTTPTTPTTTTTPTTSTATATPTTPITASTTPTTSITATTTPTTPITSSTTATTPITSSTTATTPITASSTPTTPITATTTPTTPTPVTATPKMTTTPTKMTTTPAMATTPTMTTTPITPTSVMSTSSSESTPLVPHTSQHPPPSRSVHISETNICLWKSVADSKSWFIEFSGTAHESLNGLTLVVRDAINGSGVIQHPLTGALDENGFYIMNSSSSGSKDFVNKVKGLQGILLLLYSDESKAMELTRDSMVDFLLYSIDSEYPIDSAVKEFLQPNDQNRLIVNMVSFKTMTAAASLSKCKLGTEGFVLTPTTMGHPNNCQLGQAYSLEMKLILPVKNCHSKQLPATDTLKSPLTTEIINGVNLKGQCGLSPIMLPEFDVSVHCVNDTIQEIPVKFTVHAAFEVQMTAIVDGYTRFVTETPTITLGQDIYNMDNCTTACSSPPVPHTDNDDDKNIRVTIATVVSCVGVFLILLVFIIIYMKRKRRGILQFSMTRLDEYDDDLLGDMDDFVGHQGPTFNSYK